MTKKILLVEDDPSLGFVVSDNLKERGYDVTHSNDGQAGWEVFEVGNFDLCLLDIMIPKVDGFELARRIRARDEKTPILFLSAKSYLEDKLEAFELGGDDYLTKPFSMDELIMRMEVFLRRSANSMDAPSKQLKIGTLTFDPSELALFNGESRQQLTQREADLLLFFCDNKNKMLKREVILKAIWGDDDYFVGRSLDVFISKLRKYLKADPSLKIVNYHGIGFKLEVISQ